MYLHNTSATRGITVNTTIGLVGLKPNAVVSIDGKLLLPYSTSIKVLSEQEYKEYMLNGKTPDNEKNKNTKAKPVQQEQSENVLGDIKDTIEDEGTFDFIANIFNKMSGTNESEEQTETPAPSPEPVAQTENLIESILNNIPTPIYTGPDAGQVTEQVKESVVEVVMPDALKVDTTTNEAELNKIQDEIDALKETWEQTSAVRKKEKIQKQIVQLEKQKQKLLENSIDE